MSYGGRKGSVLTGKQYTKPQAGEGVEEEKENLLKFLHQTNIVLQYKPQQQHLQLQKSEY